MRFSFDSQVITAFVSAALAVVVLTAMTWSVADEASRAGESVAHSHEVLNGLARIRGDTLQIELSSQNFRLSGDPAQLQERDQGIASRELLLAQIRRLTADSRELQQHWSSLRRVLDQRLQIARQVELVRKTQGAAAATRFANQSPLLQTRVAVYRLLDEMDALERGSLDLHQADYLATRQRLLQLGSITAILLLLLLAATYRLIRSQLRALEASRQQLADSQENLSITLHSIGDAVLATDAAGRITRMNPVAEQLTGWTLAEAVGQPVATVFHIIHELSREPALVPVERVLATGKVQGLANHTCLIARDGREWPIADSAAPITDDSGQIRGVVLVFRDVSLERSVERAMQQQNVQLERRVDEKTRQWADSMAHLHSIITALPAYIAFVSREQRYVYVNDQYRQRFAPEHDDITACLVSDILGPERYQRVQPMIEKALQGELQEYDWQPFAGVWHAIRYVPKRDSSGAVEGYYVLGNDITGRKRDEERIQALNLELAGRVAELEGVSRALRTLSAGNHAMLRASDEPGLLQDMCRLIVSVAGYASAAVWLHAAEGERLFPAAQHGFPGGLERLAGMADSMLAAITFSERPSLLQVPLGTDMASKEAVQGLSCPLWVDGRIIGALLVHTGGTACFDSDEIALLSEFADDLAFGIGMLRGRAEQKRAQAAMHYLTHHDALTGLANETQLVETLAAVMANGPPTPLALLQLNIERLSEINDALGFSHGDHILREFGRRLTECAPVSALVARLRGDEFAVLLPAHDVAAAQTVAQRLEQCLAQPFLVADIRLDVSAKTGISHFPDYAGSVHELLRQTDIAVHAARDKGVSHWLFNPQEYCDQSPHLNMAGELRQAIEGGELRVYLQPKVEMASGRVCGAEALVRWQHGAQGLLSPALFIGLAERTGLIKPLTEWMINSVLDLLQEWQQQGCALPVAVNLSAHNLRDEALGDKIRRWQQQRQLQTGLLELEITESTLMEDASSCLHVLQQWRDDGIPLYIDDFGTGYSSLSYLQRLPVEYIKIDQSFVCNLSGSKDSAAIVRSTIDLVHDLGRKTVAEGVESRADWEQLRALGCDVAQGYYIARPMPAASFLPWVAGFSMAQLARE
ncbi:PAS domain S-box-containing protein/diguanylate cyclase (GGDEF)-like protein [Aquitalea magnusonii]|uniref:PAS domain S-box-containing protein/diguanylate cyclase (GGDEF)-like protein n=2 Tax=Aquitalea magnusonii TaxID=332411 RepID=A0A318J629_9NEIS|nr:PAS domain S-box-containing protein/diguanylate cyclase (GGDEF)-like protein [Aquitalea magnusonii]